MRCAGQSRLRCWRSWPRAWSPRSAAYQLCDGARPRAHAANLGGGLVLPAHRVDRMLAEHSFEVKLAAGLESEARVAFGVLLERRGDEDLAARSLACDPCCKHHVAAQQLLRVGDHKARVQTHAKRDSGVGARRESPLQLDTG